MINNQLRRVQGGYSFSPDRGRKGRKRENPTIADPNQGSMWPLVGSVLDDLIAAHDLKKAISALKLPPTSPSSNPIQIRIMEQREKPRVRRSRARSKQLRDQVHQIKWLERTRLFQEAIHGRDESRGEMVASSNSEPLAIDRADVLVDLRIHEPGGYIHPSLRREPIVIKTQDILALKRKSEASAKPEFS